MAVVPVVETKPPQTSKNTRKVGVTLPVEMDAFLAQMSAMLGVRKGAVMMLAIALLKKFEEKNRAQLIEISRSYKRRSEVRRLFARYGVELKDRDFIF